MTNKIMNKVTLLKGDCLQKLKELEDNSVDSVVTDPPYEIGFMGKGWDDSGIANNPELWKEVLRVLKPGGHLLSFSHSRTYHRQAVAVEDAGFEIRDQIMWIYGSGFPKSHNIGKAVDKINGIEIEKGDKFNVVGGKTESNGGSKFRSDHPDYVKYEAQNDYDGWGTALKPAHEPIVMARKPFKGNVANNVLEWGTGGINVDGCRVGYSDNDDPRIGKGYEWESKAEPFGEAKTTLNKEGWNTEGRFPANIIFDEEAGKILDEQSGVSKSSKRGAHNNKKTEHTNTYTPPQAMYSDENTYGDSGGASRFFYCPKSSKKDRNEGLDHIIPTSNGKIGTTFAGNQTTAKIGANPNKPTEPQSNVHPTVKPTDLMAYLIRLITPKGGLVLDPFMGSGSTGKAAIREGMDFIGIERETEYMEIAKSRIDYELKKNKHTEFFDI